MPRIARYSAGLAAALATLVTLSGSGPFLHRGVTGHRGGYQYLSPSPGARYVSPRNNVAIREGGELDPASLTAGLVSAVGAASGPHDGSLLLSDDGRTLIFRPFVPFALGERVLVSLHSGLRGADGGGLPPIGFDFETGGVDPRTQVELLARLAQDREAEPARRPGVPETAMQPGAPMETESCTDLPSTFPPFNVIAYDDPAPGDLFLSPFGFSFGGNVTIIDNLGMPIFHRHFPDIINDFTVQPNGLLTYFVTSPPTGLPRYFALDNTYALVDSFEAGNGYVTDTHDLLLLPNGHFMLMAYDPEPVRMDLVVNGGDPNATVVGLILQELDADRNVVFQWRSWDHFEITDFVSPSGSLTANLIDYVHGNSIDLMPDGNLLLSSRHLNEITKIDRQTGDIIWRMGPHAKNNQFIFVNDPRGFSHQHDARWLPNGHMTVFDNGMYLDPPYSRAVEYDVDEVHKVATQVMEYYHTPRFKTVFMGSVRRLPSGGTLIGWGSSYGFGKLTELHEDGSVALELEAGVFVQSYRAIRAPWRGSLLATDLEAVDFGTTTLGHSVVRSLQVRNNSSDPLTIACAVSSNDAFTVTSALPLTLPPGGEETLDLAFTPSTAGDRSGRIYLRVPGDEQFVAQDVSVSGVGNGPPECGAASAFPSVLWPPNHKLVPVTIEGVVDPEGDPVSIAVTGITQNEPLDGDGAGSTCPDATLDGGAAQVRAERSGKGGGRVYHIAFRAADAYGGVCTGTVSVSVPHDQGTSEEPAPVAREPPPPYGPFAQTTPSDEVVDALGPCPKGHSVQEPEVADSSRAAWRLSLKGFEATGTRAVVEYTLAMASQVKLAVFDLSGRRVRVLEDGRRNAGLNRVKWSTSGLSPGVYFYRLRTTGGFLSSMVRVIR